MVTYDLLLAFTLALVAWGLIACGRAIHALARAVTCHTDALDDLAAQLNDATITAED